MLSPLPHFSLTHAQCPQSGFHWKQFCSECNDFYVDCTTFSFSVLHLLSFPAALGNVGHIFFPGILYSPGFSVPFSPCTCPRTCLCPLVPSPLFPLKTGVFYHCIPASLLLSLYTIPLVSSFICIILTTTAIYFRVQSPVSTPNYASELHSPRSNFARNISTCMFHGSLSTI